MSQNKHDKEIDKVTGVETTGHEWDGLKELNNPAPRWWLWVFFITVIWSIGYWVVYPAWPTLSGEGARGGTAGKMGWTQYTQLKAQQQEITDRRGAYMERFKDASFEEIKNDPELYQFALAGGKAMFKDNCATCHGTGGAGGFGYPNLVDDEWIWGGTYESIHQTLLYGIRSGHEQARSNFMPAYGADGILNQKQIGEVADYVLSLSSSGNAEVSAEAILAGATIFAENCAACHGPKGQGDKELGAPNLQDAIWLYGDGSKEGIVAQLNRPKHGVMPNWEGRLDPQTIRQLVVYVHSLGGGQMSAMNTEESAIEKMLPEPGITLQQPREAGEAAPDLDRME